MATIFGVHRDAGEDGRSAGGKIVWRRRTPACARTPYTRSEPRQPPEEPAPSSGNLKWLSGLIYPARAIASGAGKIFSTVLGPDTDSSSSSGDNSDSGYEDDVSLEGDNEMVSSLNMMGEKVHLIRQLVMQETFSREECNELIKLIQSRLVKVDESISEAGKTPDVCTTAVMEARKWLEDKKPGSSYKIKTGDQMCETNQGIVLSLVSESETGSPVDMAKTHMHARPAWSSPSLKHVEFRTLSPMENFREELSRSIFHSPLQLSETKKSPLSTGSWNIVEEIRKVRAKATEDLLATTPSKRIEFSSFSAENKSRQEPLTNNKPEKVLYNLRCRTSKANSNPSLQLATTYCSGLPEESEHDRLQNEALNSNNVLTQPQNEETIQAIRSAGAIDGCQGPYEMNGSKYSAATIHALSLSTADQNSEPRDEEMIGVIDPSKENVDGGIPYEISEPSHAIHSDDDDSTWTGSQNSSNTQHEELLMDVIQSNPKRKAQSGRQIRGYPRRGRGRGKQSSFTSLPQLYCLPVRTHHVEAKFL